MEHQCRAKKLAHQTHIHKQLLDKVPYIPSHNNYTAMASQAYDAYFILHPLPDDDSLNHPPATLDSLDNKFYKNCNCDDYNNNNKINVGLIYPTALVPATPFTFSCYAFATDAL
eukprot:11022331-Ditylum_brightwellii.AAC.1